MSELIYVIVILYAWISISLNDAAFIVLATIKGRERAIAHRINIDGVLKGSVDENVQGEAHMDFPERVDINVN